MQAMSDVVETVKTLPGEDFMIENMVIDCICQTRKALYYCDKGCLREGELQFVYCVRCAQNYHSNHFGFLIADVNNDVFTKNWGLTFEHINDLYSKFKVIYEPLKGLNQYCEKANDQLPQELKYTGLQKVSEDFKLLDTLYQNVYLNQRDEVENLINNFRIDQLLTLEKEREDINNRITYLDYLLELTPESLFDQYFNVFANQVNVPLDIYSIETCEQIIELKSRAQTRLGQINDTTTTTTRDPQSETINQIQILKKMIEINSDTISIFDQKQQKTIHSVEQKIKNTDQKQLKDEFDQFKISHNLEIERLNQLIDERLKKTEEVIQQKVNTAIAEEQRKNKQLESQLNQIVQQFATLKQEMSAQAVFGAKCVLLRTQQLEYAAPLRTFCQLANGNVICGDSNNQQLKLFNPNTLQQHTTISANGCGDSIVHVLEHNGFIFFIDYSFNLHMIRSIDYLLVNTHNDSSRGLNKRCFAVVDNNTLVCGLDGGNLQLYDIQNSRLTLKSTSQLFTGIVSQIIRIGNTNRFVMRVANQGIRIMQLDGTTFTEIQKFKETSAFTSMTLINNNFVIAQTGTTYWMFDITQQTETQIVNGFKNCHAMSPVPGYENDFIVTREIDWICLINLKSKQIYQLYQHTGHQDAGRGSEILFLRGQGLKFLTYGVNGQILELELNKEFLKV